MKKKDAKTSAAEAPLRVIIYARTSSDKERAEDGDRSIPEQVADCEAVAKEQGWKVVAVVREPNRSSWVYPVGADDIARFDFAYQRELKAHPGVKPLRDGLGKVLRAMRDGDVDMVLVRDQTRLARPLADGLMANWFKSEFVAHGVRLWSAQEKEIDFHDFGSALASDVVGRVLSEERKRRLKNSMRKIAEIRDAGKVWRILRCYGLNSDHDGGLVVDESRVPIVREIYDRVCGKESYSGITRLLARREGVPPPINGGLWTERLVANIARNPIYCGHTVNTRGILIPCTAFNHDGKNPALPKPLITRAKWEQAQTAQEGKKRFSPMIRNVDHILSGLIKCPVCGRTLFRRGSRSADGKARGYFHCQSWTIAGKPECRPIRIAEKGLDTIMRELVPLHVKAWLRAQEAASDAAARIPKIQRRRDEMVAKQVALIDNTPVDEVGGEAFRKVIGRLTAEIKELDRELVRLQDAAQHSGKPDPASMRKKSKGKPTADDYERALQQAKRAVDKAAAEPFDPDFMIVPSGSKQVEIFSALRDKQPGFIRDALRSVLERIVVTHEVVRVHLKSGGAWEFPRIFRQSSSWSMLPTVEHSEITGEPGEERVRLVLGYPRRDMGQFKNPLLYEDADLRVEVAEATRSVLRPHQRPKNEMPSQEKKRTRGKPTPPRTKQTKR